MQDEFYYSDEDGSTWTFSTPFHSRDIYSVLKWYDDTMKKSKENFRFMEVVCLGGDYDDLTVSEVICARFSDEEIQLLGLNE